MRLEAKVALFTAWYAAHAALALKLLTIPLADTDETKQHLIYASLHEVLMRLLRWEPLREVVDYWLPILAGAVLLFAVTCWIICFGFVWLIRRFSFDGTYRDTGAAWVWAIRSYFTSGAIVLSVIFLGALLSGRYDSSWATLVSGLTILGAVLMCVPIGLLDRPLLESDGFGKWHRVQWPGWSPVLMLATCLIAIAAFDAAAHFLSEPYRNGGVTVASVVIHDLVKNWAWCAALSLYLHKVGISEMFLGLRNRTRVHFFIAAQLLSVREIVIVAWVLPPIAVMTFANYWVLPQYQFWLEFKGQELGSALRAFDSGASMVGDYGWLAMLSLLPIYFLVAGRFLVLEERRRPMGSV